MITWIIETDIFNDHDTRLIEAAKAEGHEIILWDDEWLLQRKFPIPSNGFVIFHGSLGNASQIKTLTLWKPGAYCTTENFMCSSWYSACQEWLLHRIWVFTTVSEFVKNPDIVFEKIKATKSVFVRPDSPLKPFSGRAISKDNVSLKALDYGYYYDDENLPIVIAPIANVDREWRFIVVRNQVIAGSAYEADGRTEANCITSGNEWNYAQEIASSIDPPDDAYALDLCESEGKLKLLELNPFSGADHYACDRISIVKAMSTLAGQPA